MELGTGNGMETDQVDAAVKFSYETHEHVGMGDVIVDPPPHYIFKG